jgi:hypothetical protein
MEHARRASGSPLSAVHVELNYSGEPVVSSQAVAHPCYKTCHTYGRPVVTSAAKNETTALRALRSGNASHFLDTELLSQDYMPMGLNPHVQEADAKR